MSLMNTSVRYQVMPPLSPEEYQELHDSIKEQGVLEPIHIDSDGVIIDGHHRSKIASELGVPCPVITHDELDEAGKRSLAFTLNLKRRHLNREQRRALIAESLKSDPQLSNNQHAKRTGASDKTVKSVRDDLVAGSEIPNLTEYRAPDGKTYPATQPRRDPEQPRATVMPQADLDALNTRPTEQPTIEPAKPRRAPLTDEALAANLALKKAINKWESIANDDRFTANKNQIRETNISDLARAIESMETLITMLQNT